MTEVVVAPVLVALVTAILCLAARRSRLASQGVSLVGAVGYLLAVAALVTAVAGDADGVLVYELSGWQAPFGIVLVADSLSAVFLALTAVVSLAAVVYANRYVDPVGQRLSYHPLYHMMVLGVTGAFLTGDLFNLFVWFEVMLLSSYVLVVFYSGPEHTRAALQYTILNLVASAVMLLAVGGLYATLGTLNMADMARRLANPEAFGLTGTEPAVALGLGGLLLSVFALKAGLVPFQFWVPDAYRAAPAPVTAMLAGVVKKVGVYAVIRVYFTVLGAGTVAEPLLGGGEFLAFFGPLLLVMAGASIVLGGIGAVGRPDLDGLLAHSSISQVGFIVLPLGIGALVPAVRELAVVAAVVYSINHGLAKGLLFLVAGAVRESFDTLRFDELGGLTGEAPLLSGAFFVGGLALVGIPPLTGFFGKLLVFDVAAQALPAAVAVGVAGLALALGGAVLTIAYFSLAWSRGFWGSTGAAVGRARTEPTLVAVAAVLALAIVAFGVGFEPVYAASLDAAGAALDTGGYVDAVLGGDGGGGS
jgi:multicomponent Na+:H+ antiporter subunit D